MPKKPPKIEHNLPRLTNSEFEQAEALAKMAGIPLDHCPTCRAKPEQVTTGVYGFENGTYKFRGEEWECDCQTQMALRKHYLLANIGDQYFKLDWADYDGSEDVRESVNSYLEKWPSFKANGMGMEFSSTGLGTGKTFAATHIGKELIKRGERVFFVPFLEVISALTHQAENAAVIERKLKETTVVILDEVIPPRSEAQGVLFADKFEEVVRHRTNFNLITIMTTNLTEEQLKKTYPRPYSLLCAKQWRVEFDGKDARMGKIDMENIELAMNDEVRPIT